MDKLMSHLNKLCQRTPRSSAPSALVTPEKKPFDITASETAHDWATESWHVADSFSPSQIVCEKVPLKGRDSKKFAIVLHHVFSAEECTAMIEDTESIGYSAALVNMGYKQALHTDVRNNDRCMVTSTDLAAALWERIAPHVPAEFGNRDAVGINERFRFLRYYPGQYFAPHKDGCYRRGNGEISLMTAQLYLNEGFSGGTTNFLFDSCDGNFDVVPRTGSVLVFQHDILHEGAAVSEGCKYSMRTDIMFSATTNARDVDQSQTPTS